MNLVILGPQGSGKGTQAKLLADKYGLTNISSGKFLREFAKGNSKKAKLIEDLLTTGNLMPFDVVLEVIEPHLLNAKNGFVLDGTPRDLMQAEYMDWYLGKKNIKIDKVIFLNIPHDESVRRLTNRAKIEHRSDDTPEGIQERLEIYENETIPVIDYYRRQGKLIEIDGTPSIEKIFDKIVSKLEE